MAGAALGLFLTGRIAFAWRRPAHGHDHHHHHACGHQHAPSPAQVAEADSLRAAAGVVLGIGLRPCSGAVLVLGLARIIGLSWAGVAAVVAMSAGTALTVGVLALAAVKTRHWSRRPGGRLGPGVRRLADGVGARHPLGLS